MTVTPNIDRIETLVGKSADLLLLAYIEAAAAVVSDQLGMTNQPEARLNMIAEHLTAHYYKRDSEAGKVSERLPDYSVTYGRPSDLSDLRATTNGRIAVELDQSGLLGEASKPKPSFAVL